MADRVRVRVFRVVGTAYRDLLHVLQAMPGLVAIAVLIALARALIESLLPDRAIVLSQIGEFAVTALESFLLTPFFIAVHRFIILNEITRGYVLDVSDPRFLRFFIWSLLFTAMGSAAMLLQDLMQAVGASINVTLITVVVIGLAMVILTLRLTVLFPAIAVDARGATASNALADTKGNVLRILLAFAAAYLPFVILSIAFVAREPGINDPLAPIANVTLSVLYAAALPLFIAIASRIFQALADRVVGGPGMEGATVL